MAVNFKYAKKNTFQASSFTPTEQSVFNEFPRYSITFYDDQDFKFKRQSVNGKSVLSKIISDDFYPFNLSYEDRTNYIAGKSNSLKVFFAKILVYKSITQDAVGQTSNVFYLTRTQTLGTSKTLYYSVKCIEKNSQYTVYSSRISLNNSDFVNQFDGEAFFTLVGDFSVNLEYPISLTINSTPSSDIFMTTTTPIYNTIDSVVNNLNFYENVIVNFDYYQYSDSFDYNFEPLSLSLTTEVFSSSTNLYTTNTANGTSIRFNFLEGYSVLSLTNFALTLINSSPGYDPSTDTLFTITFRLSNGDFLSVNACEIFNNFQNNYHNIVFDFNDVIWPDNFINYFILEIKTLTDIVTEPYTITYLNFVKEVSNFNNFSFKSLSTQPENSTYTSSPLNTRIDLSYLGNQSIILSSDIFSVVDTIFKIKDDSNFQISTQNGSVILPESALVKSESIYIPVFNLQKGMKVRTSDSLESIIAIKVLPPSFIEMIDTYAEEDYFLNGFLVKNPFFPKSIERKLLNKKQYNTNIDKIEVNKKITSLHNDGLFSFLNKELFFKKDTANEIIVHSQFASTFKALIFCDYPVSVEYDKNVKSFNNKEIIEIKLKNDLSPIILKSRNSFSIKKLLITNV